MINKYIYKTILAMLLSFWGAQCFASGLGFSVGNGSEEWEDDILYEGDRDISNIGFVVDTAVARNKTFNYRFTLMQEENNADSGLVELDMEGLAMTHDFGFAVLRNKTVRLWLGPQLKAAFYEDLTVNGTDIGGDAVGFGIGPVVGVNVHLPQVVSFSFTAAYHLISGYAGNYDDTFSDEDLDADSNGLYMNASLIFRIDDEYF